MPPDRKLAEMLALTAAVERAGEQAELAESTQGLEQRLELEPDHDHASTIVGELHPGTAELVRQYLQGELSQRLPTQEPDRLSYLLGERYDLLRGLSDLRSKIIVGVHEEDFDKADNRRGTVLFYTNLAAVAASIAGYGDWDYINKIGELIGAAGFGGLVGGTTISILETYGGRYLSKVWDRRSALGRQLQAQIEDEKAGLEVRINETQQLLDQYDKTITVGEPMLFQNDQIAGRSIYRVVAHDTKTVTILSKGNKSDLSTRIPQQEIVARLYPATKPLTPDEAVSYFAKIRPALVITREGNTHAGWLTSKMSTLPGRLETYFRLSAHTGEFPNTFYSFSPNKLAEHRIYPLIPIVR